MAARAVTRLYDEVLRSVGLRATQLAVLVAAANESVVSITELAKFMGMDRSTPLFRAESGFESGLIDPCP